MNIKSFFSRVLGWITGGTAYYVFVWLYDYFVFSYVIWRFGAIKGGLIMIFITFFVDVVTMKFYDWSKRDWLAIETIKDLGKTNNWFGKLFKWLNDRGFFLIVIFLSLKFNPFIVTAYLRKGSHQYNGMSKRDWIIFCGSSVLGGIYWIIVIATGVSLVQYVGGILMS